jgi:hypothetical protein
MTAAEIIRAAIPNAPEELCEHILWARTPFPCGRVSAQELYHAASTYRRASEHGIELCDFCDRAIVPPNRFLCERCGDALRPVRAQVQHTPSQPK